MCESAQKPSTESLSVQIRSLTWRARIPQRYKRSSSDEPIPVAQHAVRVCIIAQLVDLQVKT